MVVRGNDFARRRFRKRKFAQALLFLLLADINHQGADIRVAQRVSERFHAHVGVSIFDVAENFLGRAAVAPVAVDKRTADPAVELVAVAGRAVEAVVLHCRAWFVGGRAVRGEGEQADEQQKM